MAITPLKTGTTSAIQIIGLFDVVEKEYILDAVVTGDLFDDAGAPVAGAADIVFAFHANPASPKDACYVGAIPADVVLTRGADYDLVLTIVATVGKWTEIIPCRVVPPPRHAVA
jgi:hypothetical protein